MGLPRPLPLAPLALVLALASGVRGEALEAAAQRADRDLLATPCDVEAAGGWLEDCETAMVALDFFRQKAPSALTELLVEKEVYLAPEVEQLINRLIRILDDPKHKYSAYPDP
eukprot:TRINITY_DN1876_c0_g1_i1.p7 TRINITY_DN1876_c0_g1~~TRINITY_DN1876_c0_g1_i1.p7  ORF type:complete len:113 (+),score=45.61 TRINITY_DN1876_c0_g1_i1:138-476(+)